MSNRVDRNTASWFKVDALEVGVFEQPSALARFAARTAGNHLRGALVKNSTASVIFATGNSQLVFLEALTHVDDLDWRAVTVFHMDEYLGISRDHRASFRRFIREKIERVLKPGQVHYMEGDALEPIKECERYTGLLMERPVDLCCLGIGENGHLAFNDPPVANFKDPRKVKIVRLDEGCRQQQVGEGHFPRLESVPQYALTLTIPMLCSARRMLCIAPEQRKAEAVRAALTGPVDAGCPASFLRRQRQATLLLDFDSARLWREEQGK
jgi:glucosamine-6-phosphate deaminase